MGKKRNGIDNEEKENEIYDFHRAPSIPSNWLIFFLFFLGGKTLGFVVMH